MHACACIVITVTRILKMPRKLSKKTRKKLEKLQKRTKDDLALEREFKDTRVFINTVACHPARTDLQGRTIYSLYVIMGAASERTVGHAVRIFTVAGSAEPILAYLKLI